MKNRSDVNGTAQRAAQVAAARARIAELAERFPKTFFVFQQRRGP